MCWMKYKSSGITRYFPISYTFQPVLVTGYHVSWTGGGTPNFNWLNGMAYSELTISGFTDHTYNGGGSINHWISMGY